MLFLDCDHEGKEEKTYHHLSSEELGDGSFNTCAFHFVLHIIQKLQDAYACSKSFIEHLYILLVHLWENSPLCRAPVHHVAWSYLVFPTLKGETTTNGYDNSGTGIFSVTQLLNKDKKNYRFQLHQVIVIHCWLANQTAYKDVYDVIQTEQNLMF